MDSQQLQQTIEELKKNFEDYKNTTDKTIQDQKEEIRKFKDIFEKHSHSGVDSSIKLKNGFEMPASEVSYFGNSGIAEVDIFDSTGAISSNTFIIAAGRDRGLSSGTAVSSTNSALLLQNQLDSTSAFFFGAGRPQYQNINKSVTSAGTTITDTTFHWTTDELAGAYINIRNSSGVFQFTRQIASNTSSVITIDGTWPSSVSGGSYEILMPIYLGAAANPWRQIYSLGEDVSSGGTGAQRRVLRFGMGTTAGSDVIGIYFGTGTPESVVTANIGSIYLRLDGSTSTTLYVKTSGTSNTGWTGK